MQELPLVALPPQQPQHFQAVGYPLLSLSRKQENTMAMAFGDGLCGPEQLWANCNWPSQDSTVWPIANSQGPKATTPLPEDFFTPPNEK